MDKYGVSKDARLLGLRDEEARLMQAMQSIMSSPGEKTASERSAVESQLQLIRSEITELDNPPQEIGNN